MSEVVEAFKNLEALKNQLNISWFKEGTEKLKASPGDNIPSGQWKRYSMHFKNRPCFSREEFDTFVEDIAKKHGLEIYRGRYRKVPFYLGTQDDKPIARFYSDITFGKNEVYLWGICIEVSRKDILKDIFDYLKLHHSDAMKPVTENMN